MDRRFWIVAAMIIIVGVGIAQSSDVITPIDKDQTNYDTGMEDKLAGLGHWETDPDTNETYFVSEAKDLSDCIPILVNEKGWYEFDTKGTGCPRGVFKVNTGELLLKFFAVSNRVDDLEARVEKLEGN